MYTLSVVFLNKFISGSDLELRKMKLIKLVKCKETTYETGYHSLVFQCNINLFLWNIHPKKIVLLCSLFLPTRCRFRAFLHNRRHTLSLAVTYVYTHTHTHTHTHTFCRTPLEEGSANRKSLYLHNTQQSQEGAIHVHGGFELAIPASEGPQSRAIGRRHWYRIGRKLPAANGTFPHIKYVIGST